jgi:hypothetical protein
LTIPAVRACVGDGATMLVRRTLGDDLHPGAHAAFPLPLWEHIAEATTLYPASKLVSTFFAERRRW